MLWHGTSRGAPDLSRGGVGVTGERLVYVTALKFARQGGSTPLVTFFAHW